MKRKRSGGEKRKGSDQHLSMKDTHRRSEGGHRRRWWWMLMDGELRGERSGVGVRACFGGGCFFVFKLIVGQCM